MTILIFILGNYSKFVYDSTSIQKKDGNGSVSSNSQIKLGVVIIARNEEDAIGNTIQSLIEQKLKPAKIVVVDDGSTDKTFEIAQSFEKVQVTPFSHNYENWVDKPELALVINTGLNELKDLNLTHVMISGADIVYPPEYINEICNYMRNHLEVAISGGMVNGEYSYQILNS